VAENSPLLQAVLDRWEARTAADPELMALMGEELRGLAFTLADVWDEKFLEAIQETLSDSIAEGEGVADWTARAQQVLDAFGSQETLDEYEGGRFSPSYADLVFRQNTISAFNAGRYAEMFDPERVDSDPYWMFSTAEDERVCDICGPLDGKVFRKDDPEANNFLPGVHFQCRCMAIELDQEALDKGEYDVSSGKGVSYEDDNGDTTQVRPADGFDVDRLAQLLPDAFRRLAG
jgi:SPP1 gp7 family putative phage head morphogenesis protein